MLVRFVIQTAPLVPTLVRETTRALGGGCSLRSYCFILPIDGAETGALNFAACVKMVSPPMRFFNRVSASYLSARTLIPKEKLFLVEFQGRQIRKTPCMASTVFDFLH